MQNNSLLLFVAIGVFLILLHIILDSAISKFFIIVIGLFLLYRLWNKNPNHPLLRLNYKPIDAVIKQFVKSAKVQTLQVWISMLKPLMIYICMAVVTITIAFIIIWHALNLDKPIQNTPSPSKIPPSLYEVPPYENFIEPYKSAPLDSNIPSV